MAIIGTSSTSYTQVNNADANGKRTYRYVAPETGTLSSLLLYCSCDSGGAGIWKAVIYSDSSGQPNALLGTSNEVSTAAGSSRAFRTATFATPVSVTSGTAYHIGFISGSGYLNYYVTTGTLGYGSYNTDTYVGGAANPFGSHSHLDPPKILIYGTVNTAPAAPSAPTLTHPTGGESLEAAQAQTFTWSTSEAQSAYTIRYKVASAGSWTTLAEVVSAVPSHTFAASTFSAGDYEWAVSYAGTTGLDSPFSSSGTFTETATVGLPTISTPSVNETITTPSYAVTWVAPDQDAYQVRRVADDAGTPDTSVVYEDSQTVTNASLRSHTLTFSVTGRTEHVQLRIHNGTWSNWASVMVVVSFTPPATATVAVVADSTNGKISITATHPTPAGAEPTVISEDIYVSESSDGSDPIRLKTNNQPETEWSWYGPASDVDYYFAVVAVATTGTTSTSAWTG